MDNSQYDNISKDGKVGFLVQGHKYVWIKDPTISFTSCTGKLKEYYEPFDTSKIAPRYAEKHNKSVEEVVASWEHERITSSLKGTYIHNLLEDLMNGLDKTSRDRYPEEAVAFKFYKDFIESGKWEVVGVEDLLYNEELKLTGQRDLKVRDTETGKFISVDYKTSKVIEKRGYLNKYTNSRKCMWGMFDILEDCEWVKYSAQLGIYEFMDPEPTDEKIIVHIKPDSYELIPALDIKIGLNEQKNDIIFANRKQYLTYFEDLDKALPSTESTDTIKHPVTKITNITEFLNKTKQTNLDDLPLI